MCFRKTRANLDPSTPDTEVLYMKFDEIFPRSKFPLRAKTKVQISDTVTMRMSVFSQKPFLGLGDYRHTCGVARVIFEHGIEVLAFAIIYPANNGKSQWFRCVNGDWAEIGGGGQDMANLYKEELRFLGPACVGLPFAGIEHAEWKSF